jgi:heptosyltransferase-2
MARAADGGLVDACDLSLLEATALLAQANVFAGVDSGPLNLAAAVGTKAFGMFGNTPVLTYSKHIEAVLPEGSQGPDAMARIAPAGVARRVASYLAQAR